MQRTHHYWRNTLLITYPVFGSHFVGGALEGFHYINYLLSLEWLFPLD